MQKKKERHIILEIKNDGIFFNPEYKIDWNKTNFPNKKHFKFQESKSVYWLVKMISFSTLSNGLTIEITNYNQKDHSTFKTQKSKSNIDFLEFKSIHWNKLKSCLSVYKTSEFKNLNNAIAEENSEFKMPENLNENQKFEFLQPISKLEFKMGYVQTTRSLKGISRKTLINIYNPYIIPEFEFIKSYFNKVFDGRKVKILGYILNKNDRSTYHFTSPHISMIDHDLIDGIKKLELKKKVTKPKLVVIDKSLFTPEEYFDGFEANLGNQIRKSNQALLSDILSLKDIRNRKQLEYLAGYLQSKFNSIHFTLTPKFGFLFSVRGNEMNHSIWELLDTNATYIWSADKNIPREVSLKIISEKINFIQVHGRTKYNLSEDNNDLIFSKINHKNASSNLIDGFPRWLKEINEILV